MDRACRLRALATLAVFTWLGACASSAPGPGESLDPVTGVTITAVPGPLVLFRDQSAQAAHARDYLHIAPLRVNRSGQHDYFLWLGAWSTLPTAETAALADAFESIVLFADGEPMPLVLAGFTPDRIHASAHVYAKPVAAGIDAYYPVTRDQLRKISEATDIRVRVGSTHAVAYERWGRARAESGPFRAFLDATY